MKISKIGKSASTKEERAKVQEKKISEKQAVKIQKHKQALKKLEDAGLDDKYRDMEKVTTDPVINEVRQIYCRTCYGKEYTPSLLKKSIDGYFLSVDSVKSIIVSNSGKEIKLESRRAYTVEGMCDYIGMTKDMLLKYATDKTYESYHDIIRLAVQKIVAKLLDLGLAKEVDSALTKFYLKNISDLRDEVKTTTASRYGNITFVTVNSHDDLKSLAGEVIEGQLVDE